MDESCSRTATLPYKNIDVSLRAHGFQCRERFIKLPKAFENSVIFVLSFTVGKFSETC